MNNRRNLIVAFAVGAFAFPLGSFAQTPLKGWRIAVLNPWGETDTPAVKAAQQATSASPIVELALQHKLSWVSNGSRRAQNILASYGTDFCRTAQSAAMMAVRIFKGVKPAAVPNEQRTYFNLVVNPKTGKPSRFTAVLRALTKQASLRGHYSVPPSQTSSARGDA